MRGGFFTKFAALAHGAAVPFNGKDVIWLRVFSAGKKIISKFKLSEALATFIATVI